MSGRRIGPGFERTVEEAIHGFFNMLLGNPVADSACKIGDIDIIIGAYSHC